MAARRAVIAGAGIGGLAAAVGLHRRGWDVHVFERSASLEPAGAGISLWPNALRALDLLDVGSPLRDRAAIGGQNGIRRPDGRWIARADIGDAIRARFGAPLVVVHRAELVDVLARALPEAAIRTGVTVTGASSVGQTVGGSTQAIVCTDAGGVQADLVVAADGIRSRLREIAFPRHPGPRYAGYTSWRIVVPAPGGEVGFETWGPRGERFAVVPMTDGRCYCYATANAPPGERHDDEAAELTRRYGGWHDPIPRILAGVRPQDVLHTDIEELAPPLPAYHVGRLALLGDAAHAMTPDLGQGGCLALEDAVVLAACVGTGDDSGSPGSGLPEYTAARWKRTTRIARRSRQSGRLYQSALPARTAAARLMGLIPASVLVRGLAPVVDWDPPAAPR